MTKTFRSMIGGALLSAALIGSATSAQAQTCQPGIATAFAAHQATYTQLLGALLPGIGNIQTKLGAVVDQPTYASLLADAHTLAGTVPNGRVVITVPDGTVVLDTGKPDDPANMVASGNSFQHFENKTVNENHNSRVAIFDAQEWPCGIGLERKLSTTTGVTETYVAFRLGAQLDNLGTVRLSTH